MLRRPTRSKCSAPSGRMTRAGWRFWPARFKSRKKFPLAKFRELATLPGVRLTPRHHCRLAVAYNPFSVKLLGVCRMLLVDKEPMSRANTLVLVSYVENGLMKIAALKPDSSFNREALPITRE